ncbi:unnamed protein product, partial [Effrenium voratum]
IHECGTERASRMCHAGQLGLRERVEAASAGQLRLVDTPDRGRCLEAVTDLPAGHRLRDAAVVPHGSSLGRHLARVSSCEDVASTEMLAALDFLASLLLDLHVSTGESVLHDLHAFPGEPPKVPLIRRWHKRWSSSLTDLVAVSELEQAWAHVIPNWRQLTVSCPVGRKVVTPEGEMPALSHDMVCGLWLHMALCEHSCDPNCSLVHDGDDLWLVMMRPVAAGCPITTSYLDVAGLLKPVQDRQQELQDGWGFHCACHRCSLESESESPELSLEPLLMGCSSPPGLLHAERNEYMTLLHQLLARVRTLHNAHSPAEQMLLLLQSLFAPTELQEDACREHAEACAWLFGAESRFGLWARELLQR